MRKERLLGVFKRCRREVNKTLGAAGRHFPRSKRRGVEGAKAASFITTIPTALTPQHTGST